MSLEAKFNINNLTSALMKDNKNIEVVFLKQITAYKCLSEKNQKFKIQF